jgi:hypothetical protein
MYTVTPKDVITFWTDAGPALWFAENRDFDARLRWSFFGASDVSVGASLAMTLVFMAICLGLASGLFGPGMDLAIFAIHLMGASSI